MKPIAIIPARGGSKRLPNKNILPLGGKPMLSHPIIAAKQSEIFSDIYVSSDSEKIRHIAQSHGAIAVTRPEETATDTAHELSAVEHLLHGLEMQPEHFCVIYPTAVGVLPEDFMGAYERLLTTPECAVMMGVSAYHIHPYKALQPSEDGYWRMAFPEHCTARSQHYPHMVASNGTFYWFNTQAFLQNPSYYQDRLATYEIPSERAIDIDTAEDYARAQAAFSDMQ